MLKFDEAAAETLLSLLVEAAGARLDPRELDRLALELEGFPFDATATAAVVLLSRRLPQARSALLLSIQAEAAPATTLLRRTSGQLFLLAGQMLAEGERPDAPLAALHALASESDVGQVTHGALWALMLTERCQRSPALQKGTDRTVVL